jgi:hypothetical protein
VAGLTTTDIPLENKEYLNDWIPDQVGLVAQPPPGVSRVGFLNASYLAAKKAVVRCSYDEYKQKYHCKTNVPHFQLEKLQPSLGCSG